LLNFLHSFWALELLNGIRTCVQQHQIKTILFVGCRSAWPSFNMRWWSGRRPILPPSSQFIHPTTTCCLLPWPLTTEGGFIRHRNMISQLALRYNIKCLVKVWSYFWLFSSICILLSRKSDGGTIFWTNLRSLRSCQYPSFPVDYVTLSLLICFLFKATKQRYILKRLIQGRNHAQREWKLSHQDRAIMITYSGVTFGLSVLSLVIIFGSWP